MTSTPHTSTPHTQTVLTREAIEDGVRRGRALRSDAITDSLLHLWHVVSPGDPVRFGFLSPMPHRRDFAR